MRRGNLNSTQRLDLPFIVPGQAQKELFHNEALQRLDSLVCGMVEGVGVNDPPEVPTADAAYLVGPAPIGDWAGQAGHLAIHTAGGWRFVAPFEGLQLLQRGDGLARTFRNGTWEIGRIRAHSLEIGGQQVVGARLGAIIDPAGGTQVDSEARAAIGQMLSALRTHGLIAS